MKTTRTGWDKVKIQTLLDTSDHAVERALVRIYKSQTASEKSSHTTHDSNNIGFNSIDADFMSGLAESCIKYNGLTDKQLVFARKKIKKYWKQLMDVADNSPIVYRSDSARQYQMQSNGE